MNKEYIGVRTLFLYYKINYNVYKGYWVWSNKFKVIKNKLIEKVVDDFCLNLTMQNMKKIGNDQTLINLLRDIRFSKSIYKLKNIIKKLNNIYKLNNLKIQIYFFENTNKALIEVKKHGGDIYVDYDKTFINDCLIDE